MQKFYLVGEINEVAFENFAQVLDTGKGALLLDISSQGGNSYDMLAFVDKILCSNRKVVGTAFGLCMSAAVLILAVCDERRASPNTIFMVHEDSSKLSKTTTELLIEAAQHEKEEQHWARLMSEHTAMSQPRWRNYIKETSYFDADEALELGVIDSVLPRGAK